MTSISKTAAIREARSSVSIHGAGTSWTVIGPYKVNDPSGPSTESHHDSWDKARLAASGWKACVALALMGKYSEDTEYAVSVAQNDPYASHTVEALVSAGLKAAR